MDKWKIVKSIEDLLDRAVSDLSSNDADWVLIRIKDTIEELLEE
ncbi:MULTISPECIES: hypothetical protein [unclassified Clostridium]|nr:MULTISPECIES: hypothetical protein [unclassified Clostridium]